ncbi:MAG: hypothetical protein ACREMA_08310, partial [Longimicrobiales bacterium]
NLTSRLDEVAAKTRDISSDTESTLRVGVRVERERLKDALRALSPFTPGSEDSLKLIEKEIEALRKRVDVVDELDEMRRRLALLRVQTSKAPATILRRAGRSLNGASSLLNQRAPTDADLQTAQATIRTVAARLDVLEQEDAAFAGELAGRIKDLRLQYAVTRACPKYAAIEPKLKDLLGILDRSEFEDTANIKPGLYHLLDLATDKLFILQHYIIRFEDSAADRDRHRAVEDVEPRLFDCLRSVNAVGLIMADRLKSEIEENVYTDHIVEQLQARKVKIRYEPLTVYANAPVRLWIEFNDPRFNHAAALQEFRCIWDFGEIVGLEEGWEISHYFRNTEEANITVHFTGLDGNVITVKPDGPAPPTQPLTLTLKVPLLQRAGGRKDRLKLEAVQAVVALVIAVLALMGGALEQFLKLDVLPGLMAVFALGFSADRIKNLFSKT